MSDPVVLSLQSQLIDDFLYVNDPPPLALSETNSMVAIGGGVMAIDDTKLVFFEPTPRSQSGWSSKIIKVTPPQTAVGPGIVQIKGFLAGGNKPTLNILCLFKARTGFAVQWLRRTRADIGGDWRPTRLSQGAASLLSQVTHVDCVDAGLNVGLFVYGATTPFLATDRNNARLFTIKVDDWINSDTTRWSVGRDFELWQIGCGAKAVPQFSFLTTGPLTAPRPVTMVWWDTTISDQQTIYWAKVTFDLNGFTSSILSLKYQQTQIRKSIVQLIPNRLIANGNSQAYLLSTDGGLTRYSFPAQGNNPDILPIGTGLGAIYQAIRRDGSDAIFAVTQGQRLNLLRNTNSSDNAWVDLGPNYSAVAVPESPVVTLELFYAQLAKGSKTTYVVTHMSESRTHDWTETQLGDIVDDPIKIANGSIEPNEVSSIAINLAVVGAKDGRPAGRSVVTVDSTHWVNLIIDNLSYWVGPGQAQVFTTDKTGAASIRQEAANLKFPKLTFTATLDKKGGNTTPSRYVQGDFVEQVGGTVGPGNWGVAPTSTANRLAGEDPTFDLKQQLKTPQGTTKDRMRKKVPQSLIPSKAKAEDVEHLTSMLKTVGKWQLNQQRGVTPTAEEVGQVQYWSVGPDKAGTFDCERASAATWAAAVTVEGFWSGFWGDVTHLAKRALTTVDDWLVKVEAKAGAFILAIKVKIDDVWRHVEALSIEAAGDLVQTILASIADAEAIAQDVARFVREVVAFLMMLFDWSDILYTHMAFNQVISWMLDAIPLRVKDIQTQIDDGVASLKKDVGTKIQDAISYLTKHSTTANTLAPGGSTTLQGATYRQHLDHHASRCHYVTHHSRSAMHTSKMVTDVGKGGAGKGIDAIKTHWNTKDNQTKSTTLANAFDKNGIDVKDICDTAISKLLEIVQDAVNAMLTGVDVVLDAMFDVIKTSIEAINKLLTQTIEIPVITWLWKNVISEGTGDLSILDILCLVFAVPATILYKLIKGSAPFSETDAKTDLPKLFLKTSGTIDFAYVSVATAGIDGAGASGRPFYETIAPALGICSGVAGLFGAAFGASGDYYMLDNAYTGDEEPDSNLTILTWLAWGGSAASTILAMPLAMFATYKKSLPASVAQTVYYGLTLYLSVLDLALIFATKGPLKNQPFVGPLADGFFGLGIVGASVIYITLDAVENGTKDGRVWNWLNAGLSNLPRPLRLGAVPLLADVEPISRDVIYAIAQVLVYGGDLVAGIGGPVTQIGSNL